MSSPRAALFAVLLAGLAPPPAALAAAQDVAGRWAATLEGGARIELDLEARGAGFEVRLVRDGRPLFSGTFAATERPAVFEAVASGLFAVLGRRRAPANPLEGEQLVWAREVAHGLVLARLTIERGRPLVERARLERRDDRLRLLLDRFEEATTTIELEAELARRGG
ncbi:MAG: hypothetical protein N3D77_05540 [Geminicoccaceae bacterium]|nr:hypothetical protein [Geminicoccaceae bacterium]